VLLWSARSRRSEGTACPVVSTGNGSTAPSPSPLPVLLATSTATASITAVRTRPSITILSITIPLGGPRILPLAARLAQPGARGENISTEGMTETDVCIGDVCRLGTALVQVSQGRPPCRRLNERFSDSRMVPRVEESGRTGWYHRVLGAGRVAAGDAIRLVERPVEEWTLERVLRVLHRDAPNADCLARLADPPPLTGSWRDLARRRIESRTVGNGSRRLKTAAEAVT
jgi:hypothetical protein